MSKRDKREAATAKSVFTSDKIKIIKISRALPSKTALSTWGPGPRAFVEKLKKILEGQ